MTNLFQKPYFKYKEAKIIVWRNYNEKDSLLSLDKLPGKYATLVQETQKPRPKSWEYIQEAQCNFYILY